MSNNTAVQMPTLDERYQRSLSALNDLPAGSSAWFWVTTPSTDGLPFFVIVPQDTDPDGKKFVRRAQWVADQEAPLFTARGAVRRLASGLLTLSTTAPVEAMRVVYAGLCQRAPMPDLLVMQLDGGRVVATQLLQDLQPLSAAVEAMAPGETRWFTLSDSARPDRLQVAADRSTLRADAPVRGQLRCTDSGDFLLRIDADQARPLVSDLQQWGRQAAAWPPLQALSCARIVVRNPKLRKSA